MYFIPLLITTDTLSQITKQSIIQKSNFFDYTINPIWLWISIVEFILLIILLIQLRKCLKKDSALNNISKDKLKNAQNAEVDMSNLMDSINKSRDLYKELSRKCHPDKFINSEYQEIANAIFQEISNEQRNYEKLSALKIRAIKELNIKF